MYRIEIELMKNLAAPNPDQVLVARIPVQGDMLAYDGAVYLVERVAIFAVPAGDLVPAENAPLASVILGEQLPS